MNKIFTKTLSIVMALLMVFTCFALVGCAKSDEDNSKTTAATEATKATDDAQSTADEVPATTAPVVKKSVLGKIYKPTEAFKNGENVNLETVYGTGYAKHGDELVFNEDGTFTAYIGVTAGPETTTGTYEIKSASEIVLTYNNDKIETATAVTFNIDETIQQLRIAKNDVFVIFTRAE
ncbi:MAG: copper resistance protein NlpE [Ruminococcaceae bacterium]|nr:copper resistance protein NlpE [Oscillospiraceae bacterium]